MASVPQIFNKPVSGQLVPGELHMPRAQWLAVLPALPRRLLLFILGVQGVGINGNVRVWQWAGDYRA